MVKTLDDDNRGAKVAGIRLGTEDIHWTEDTVRIRRGKREIYTVNRDTI